ncbi:hypothetical protein [Pseudodesulfovibrio sp.]|uniref:hypothetical protein n=1 Tax=Pseudodesulfovibrio sp. TaxID=2035812 RepID=UPI002609E39F|nr:hypothetical protein [Pseudodesulfovibrio sp.]MDD3312025.1 hypothetical protein [Pseudodesulfovibrio sp.]
MSDITATEPISEYAPDRYERARRDIEPAPERLERVQAPVVKAEAAQQDQKTTVQGFAYTGKGAFIDGVF